MPIDGEPKSIKLSIEEFYKRSVQLVDEGNKYKIHLRMLGAAAVYYYLHEAEREKDLFVKLGRIGEGINPFTDLDLIAYKKEFGKVVEFLEDIMHFKPEKSVNAIFGMERNIFHSDDNTFDVDVFYSCLNFSHQICWGDSPSKGKLTENSHAIAIDDVIAEKLQIHDINRKDLIDLTLLFMLIGRKGIKLQYSLLLEHTSDDWGYWYDSLENLKKVLDFSGRLRQENQITDDEYKMVIEEVNNLIFKLNTSEKTKNWIKRSKKGTSVAWYNEIEEVVR